MVLRYIRAVVKAAQTIIKQNFQKWQATKVTENSARENRPLKIEARVGTVHSPRAPPRACHELSCSAATSSGRVSILTTAHSTTPTSNICCHSTRRHADHVDMRATSWCCQLEPQRKQEQRKEGHAAQMYRKDALRRSESACKACGVGVSPAKCCCLSFGTKEYTSKWCLKNEGAHQDEENSKTHSERAQQWLLCMSRHGWAAWSVHRRLWPSLPLCLRGTTSLKGQTQACRGDHSLNNTIRQ